MGKRETSLESFWDKPLLELLQLLQATPAGLTDSEAKQRLRLYGANSMVQESRFAGLLAFLRFFLKMPKDSSRGTTPIHHA